MRAEFDWYDDEQTVILAEIDGGWHFDDLLVIVAKVEDMMAMTDHIVDVILDYSEAKMPTGNLVSVVQELVKTERPQLGLVTLVGMGMFINTILEAALKIFSKELSNFRVAASVDDAIQLIEAARQARES